MDKEQCQQLLGVIEQQGDLIKSLEKRLSMIEGLLSQMVKECGYDTREDKKDE